MIRSHVSRAEVQGSKKGRGLLFDLCAWLALMPGGLFQFTFEDGRSVASIAQPPIGREDALRAALELLAVGLRFEP